MTLPAKIYPEPMEDAGSDSPQALLVERPDDMGDSEDDEDIDFIPAVINNKVRKAAKASEEVSKVAWSR